MLDVDVLQKILEWKAYSCQVNKPKCLKTIRSYKSPY